MESNPEAPPSVAGIILAAGLGRRMGSPKLLLPWQGRPIVRHVAETALASHLVEVLAVTGHAGDQVASALADLPLRIVHNPEYETGLSTSLHAGIRALGERSSAVLIMLADQPLLTPTIIDRLLEAYWTSRAPVVVAVAGPRRGNPVLFERGLYPELLRIQGDQGARRVIEAHRSELQSVEVDERIFYDVDTPAAYSRLIHGSARLTEDPDTLPNTASQAASTKE